MAQKTDRQESGDSATERHSSQDKHQPDPSYKPSDSGSDDATRKTQEHRAHDSNAQGPKLSTDEPAEGDRKSAEE